MPQAYLDRIRSAYGAGMGTVRNSNQRSDDQNTTVSGNPNTVNNQSPQYIAPRPVPPQPAVGARLTPAQVQAQMMQYRAPMPVGTAPQTGYAAYQQQYGNAANAMGALPPNTATMPNVSYQAPMPATTATMQAPVQPAPSYIDPMVRGRFGFRNYQR